VREGFNPDKSTNGTFFVVAPGDNNTSFTGEFGTFPPGTPGTLLGGSGPSSFHWGFKKNFVLEPDTEYTVTVKADADCAGFTGKLNPGY
jgi:hypothetical protein